MEDVDWEAKYWELKGRTDELTRLVLEFLRMLTEKTRHPVLQALWVEFADRLPKPPEPLSSKSATSKHQR